MICNTGQILWKGRDILGYIRKNRNARIKKYILISIAVAGIFILSAAGYTYKKAVFGRSNDTITNDKATVYEKQVVRAKTKINAGELSDITKFEIVRVQEQLVPDNAVSTISAIKDKIIKNDIYAKEVVLASDIIPENAWYEDGDRLMEHNFSDGAIPADVAAGSMIDIKLFRQGAEDNVVISKITVVSRNANLLAFYLNAAEQENIKEASTEGLLFAVKYIDSSQTPSEITYIPGYRKKGANNSAKAGAIGFANVPELNK